jgi:hypothetical protein
LLSLANINFKYRRLVGTQFPPWNEGTDVWGVQHMMHPDLNEPVFAEWYGSPDAFKYESGCTCTLTSSYFSD